MTAIPLTSGAYQAASLIANAQRCVNLYPEANPEKTKPNQPTTHYVRPGLSVLSAPALPKAAVPNVLALDGTPVVAGNGVFGPGGTSFSMPSGFTNAKPNSIIIAVFASEGGPSGPTPQPTVSGVSDNSGQGLTWRKLASVGWIDTFAVPFDLAVWWTIAPAAFSNVTVKFTTSASIGDDATAIVFAVSGVTAVSPWDDSLGLPATKSALTGVSPTPSIGGLSTTSPVGMLLAFGAARRNTNHSGWDVAGGGFTLITHSVNFQDAASVSLGAEFVNFSAALPGVSATFDNSAFAFQGNGYGMIAGALVPGFT